MTMIASGTLDRRITIEKKSTVKDAEYGSEETVAWLPVAARIPARAVDALPTVRRMERIDQGLETASQMTRIRIRYRSGITPDMRIVLHGKPGDPDRILQIISGPAEVGRREGLEFMTESWSV